MTYTSQHVALEALYKIVEEKETPPIEIAKKAIEKIELLEGNSPFKYTIGLKDEVRD